MSTKRTPTYDLVEVQRQVAANTHRITVAARNGAALLGLDETDIAACIASLTRADFYKSMEADQRPGLWQDVYRPVYEGQPLYVKLQITGNLVAVVISFKEL